MAWHAQTLLAVYVLPTNNAIMQFVIPSLQITAISSQLRITAEMAIAVSCTLSTELKIHHLLHSMFFNIVFVPPGICIFSYCHQLFLKTQWMSAWIVILLMLRIRPSMASSASPASPLHATSLAVCGHCTRELCPIQGISIEMYLISMTSLY